MSYFRGLDQVTHIFVGVRLLGFRVRVFRV
jgi:hypothetical protein